MAASKRQYTLTRALPERGYLVFEFPQPGRDAPLLCTLPFFENPIITESGAAKYQQYNPVGRSSSLFSYLHSPSRKINLTFNITMDHAIEAYPDTVPAKYIGGTIGENTEAAKAEFFTETLRDWRTEKGATAQYQIEEHLAKFNEILFPPPPPSDEPPPNAGSMPDVLNRVSGFFSNIADWFSDESGDEGGDNATKVMETLLWWTNLVRASVKNNNSNTSYGPPIVRLNFGPMYNHVPFVCFDYNITPMKDAGLDLKTLFPRRFEITMSLTEIRVGDFKEYSPASNDTNYHRDAHGGWETIFKFGTSDPHELGGAASRRW